MRLTLAFAAAASLIVLCGCNKSADTAGTTPGGAPAIGGAPPTLAPEVQSQISAQQKAEAAERGKRPPAAPK